MYCEKVEKNDQSIYGFLVGMATFRNIDVYEIDGPDPVSGIYYNYSDEGIEAKVFMVNRKTNKEYLLAKLLTSYTLSKDTKGYILQNNNPNNNELLIKYEKIAKRLINLLEKKCKKQK